MWLGEVWYKSTDVFEVAVSLESCKMLTDSTDLQQEDRNVHSHRSDNLKYLQFVFSLRLFSTFTLRNLNYPTTGVWGLGYGPYGLGFVSRQGQ
jgi:hypothetical protein